MDIIIIVKGIDEPDQGGDYNMSQCDHVNIVQRPLLLGMRSVI